MIRRSFRLGLTLGLVCGVAFALVKMLGGRSARPAPGAARPAQPWPPLRTDPITTSAASAAPRPGASGRTAPAASTAALQQPTAAAGSATGPQPAPRPHATPGSATGPQPAPGPQATRPRPPDEVVGPADEAPAAPAAPARRAKKAPLKAAPVPAEKAPLKAEPAATGKAAGAAPKKPAKRAKKAAATAWVVPDGDVCPTSHPVKAKLSSKIFHLPGMLNYLRTRPDRCYVDAAAAEADGLRPAKR